jgi:hypothetical protein
MRFARRSKPADARTAVAVSDKATALGKIDAAMQNPALDAPSQQLLRC